jgi:hypothetical protein
MVSKELPDLLQVNAPHSIQDADFDHKKSFLRNGSQFQASTVSAIRLVVAVRITQPGMKVAPHGFLRRG